MATHFDLRRDYERGASVLELADREGVDCKTMRGRLSRAGTKMRPRGRRTVANQARRVYLRGLYEAGATTRELADAEGVHPQTMRVYLASVGARLPSDGSFPWKKRRERLRREYEAGASVLGLAEREGVTESAIYRNLAAAGANLRSAGARR